MIHGITIDGASRIKKDLLDKRETWHKYEKREESGYCFDAWHN